MCDDFIKTINDVDFIYGFIYECPKLINNLHEYDNYNYSYKIMQKNCYANNYYYKKRTYRRI